MAAVIGLGYAIVRAPDLDEWVQFGQNVLGFQLTIQTEDHLEFRMDEKEYRLIVERADTRGVNSLGWEVRGPGELDELANAVEALGYEVTRHSREEARERRVSALVSFRDPDDVMTLELYYGLREAQDLFVSPVGAVFETGDGGMGHIFQPVTDEKTYFDLYVGALGMRLTDHIESSHTPPIDLNFFHCNSRHHTLAFAQVPGRVSGVGHLMFEVTDLDVVGRALDRVLVDKAAPLIATLGKHTNDKMVSFYVRSPSGFGIEYGTAGIKIDPESWVPTRYSEAHYWGHDRAIPVDPTDPADAE